MQRNVKDMNARTLIICTLCLRSVYSLDWWGNYMEGVKAQIALLGWQEFPAMPRRQTAERVPFCPDVAPSAQVPTRADRVRPADVRVVAALGDSLTAAIGANASHILDIPTEYRQLSWSIGGYGNLSDAITLPNILKLFNPSIAGFGRNSTVFYKPPSLEDSGLNLAITGANSFLLPQQTRHLIDTMKSYPGVDFAQDWKVVSIFIGANDLCDFCKNKSLFSADSFIHNLTASLDMLHRELPRAIVNVIQLFQMEHVRKVNDRSLGCILQRYFCSCVVQPKDNSSELLELLDQNKQFQEKLEHLLETSGRYDGKEDFAVVLQPFLKNIKPATDHSGNIDYSFFSPDCFHLSVKGHEQLAKGLWNNMLQPTGQKSHLKTFSEAVELLCPSKDHPYIYTKPWTGPPNASYSHRGSRILIALLLLAVLYY